MLAPRLVTALLLSSVLLSACGAQSTTPVSSTPAPATPATANPGTSAPSYEPSAELLAKAKAEGSVTFATSSAEAFLNRFVPVFEKKYGIKVNWQRISSGPLRQRITADFESNGNPQIDVSGIGDDAFVIAHGAKGGFEKLDPNELPALKLIPAGQKNDYHVVHTALSWGMLYNTTLVKPTEVPKSYLELADTKWKNKVNIVSAQDSAGIQIFYYGLVDKYGEEQVTKFADALMGPNGTKTSASGTVSGPLVAAGEYAITFPLTYGTYAELKAKGAPVEYVYLDPAYSITLTASVHKGAKHLNAAKLLINFLMSPEGQDAYNGAQNGISPNIPNLAGQQPAPDKIIFVKPEDLAKRQPYIKKTFADRK